MQRKNVELLNPLWSFELSIVAWPPLLNVFSYSQSGGTKSQLVCFLPLRKYKFQLRLAFILY